MLTDAVGVADALVTHGPGFNEKRRCLCTPHHSGIVQCLLASALLRVDIRTICNKIFHLCELNFR